MFDTCCEFVQKILKNILSAKATPYWAIFSVLLLGLILTYAIIDSPTFAAGTVVTLTILSVAYLSFLAYAVKNETIRLSDIADVPNYPYQTLLSEQTWYLDDSSGKIARLEKKKVLKVLEPLSTIYEYGWGDAKKPSIEDIKTESGKHIPTKVFEQGSKYVIEIKLDREYKPGEEISLYYSKVLKDAFTSDKEWTEIFVTTNVGKTIMVVVFPHDRPFTYAKGIHRHGDYVAAIPLGYDLFIEVEEDGRKILRWNIPNPIQRDTYTIEWTW